MDLKNILAVPSIWSQSLLSAEPALKTMTFALSLSHPYPPHKVYIYIFCKAAKEKHQKEPVGLAVSALNGWRERTKRK